jgi:hypothetical protein
VCSSDLKAARTIRIQDGLIVSDRYNGLPPRVRPSDPTADRQTEQAAGLTADPEEVSA